MGEDLEHEREASLIMGEFARSDGEVWRESERAVEAR